MKAFACGDVIPGCNASFTASDEDGIFAQIGPHALDAHGVAAPTPELVSAVRGHIRTV